jgi:hypothetical protein
MAGSGPTGLSSAGPAGPPITPPCSPRRFAERCCASSSAGGLERLSYDAEEDRVTYRSEKAEGPTAGTVTVEPLGFLARLVTHIPNPGQVMTRYYGWYVSRTRCA